MHNHGKQGGIKSQHVKRSVCQWLFRKTSLHDNLCWKFICKSRNLDFNVNERYIIQENPLCNHFRVFILSHGLEWRGWHQVTYISPSLTPRHSHRHPRGYPPGRSETDTGLSGSGGRRFRLECRSAGSPRRQSVSVSSDCQSPANSQREWSPQMENEVRCPQTLHTLSNSL